MSLSRPTAQHVAEEVLVVAVVIPHGLTALHTVREFDLDGWDLFGPDPNRRPLRHIGDWRPKASIAHFLVVAFEAFRDLFGEGHFLGVVD
jgi:hypothetical protein